MSQVYNHLLSIAAKKGDHALIAKLALSRNIEEGYKGNRLQGVFLDNAYSDVSSMLSPSEWRQALATLAKRGEYEASQDPEYRGRFGYVVNKGE